MIIKMVTKLVTLISNNIFSILYKKYRFKNYYEEIPKAISLLNLNYLCQYEILNRLNKVKFVSKEELLEYYHNRNKIDFYLITYYIIKYDLLDIYKENKNEAWDYTLLTKLFAKPILKTIHRRCYCFECNDVNCIYRKKKYIETNIDLIKNNIDKPWDYSEISKSIHMKEVEELFNDNPHKDWDFKEITHKSNYNFLKKMIRKYPDKEWDFNSNLTYTTKKHHEIHFIVKFLVNIIEDYPNKNWDFKALSDHLDEFHIIELFYQYPNKNWDFQKLSNYYQQLKSQFYEIDFEEPIDIYEIQQFHKSFIKSIHKNWNYKIMINIVPEYFILENLDYNWDFEDVIKKNITIKQLKKIYTNLDFSILSKKIPLKKIIKHGLDHPWDYNELTKRCIELDYRHLIYNYPTKPWNIKLVNDNLLHLLKMKNIPKKNKLNYSQKNILNNHTIWNIINKFQGYLWNSKIIEHAKSIGITDKTLKINNRNFITI